MATIHRVFVYLLYVWRAKPVETESTYKRFDDHELWLIVTIERQFDFEIVILSNEFWFFENSSKDNEPPKYIFQMEYDIWQSLKNRFISNKQFVYCYPGKKNFNWVDWKKFSVTPFYFNDFITSIEKARDERVESHQ